MTVALILLSSSPILYQHNAKEIYQQNTSCRFGGGFLQTRTDDTLCYKTSGEDDHCYLPLIHTQLNLAAFKQVSIFSQLSRLGVICLKYVSSVLQKKLFYRKNSY